MCTEQSNPSKQLNGTVRPIMADKPVDGHPPLFVNVKITSAAFLRGPMTHHMNAHRDDFDQRQSRGHRCVKKNREADDGNGKERSVPGFVLILLIVQDDQALNDRSNNEGDAG
jgi:hypothetical protein